MIHRQRMFGTALVLASLLATAGASAQGAPATSAIDDADAAMKEGVAAAAEGKLEAAAAAFERAFASSPRFDVAANLGDVELELKRFPEAAEHLSLALEGAPVSLGRDTRSRLEQGLAKARAQVLTIELTVEPPGPIDLLVDGRPRTASGGRLFAAPGKHVVEARRAGAHPWKGDVEGGAGETAPLAIRFEEEGGALRPPAEDVSSDGWWVAPTVVGGIGLVGVGIGVALVVASGSELTDARLIRGEIREDGGQCPSDGAGDPRCAEMQSAADSGATLELVGGLSLGVGAAAVVTGITWLLLAMPDEQAATDTTANLRIVPVAGSQVGGVRVLTTF